MNVNIVSSSDCDAIRDSGLFDEEWYLKEYPDVKILGMDAVEHYLWIGAKLGRNPSLKFSTLGYLKIYPDVASANVNPLVHYVFQGEKEGRRSPAVVSPMRWLPTQTDYVERSTAAPLRDKPVRVIAFYLPQFHPIPENDIWWGEGFTEWTNVRPATQQFKGHYQPHVPHADIGHYDLRDEETQKRQIELAKLYGIEGFCFYYYRFNGKRLLEKPINNYLNDKNLDFPFCLCWANENWSRRWDGLDSEILIGQEHTPEDDIGCIEDLAQYMRDPRYIRIDGKPLVLVYRPSLLPSASETAKRWRSWCLNNGIGEIYLAYTQSFEKSNPEDYGFDAAIEFPPNNSGPPDITETVYPLNVDYKGKVYDWTIFEERSRNYEEPGYKIFRSVCPGWDNTARRKQSGTTFVNNTPSLYQSWLKNAIDDTVRRYDEPSERLVFVNAWNEWAEGAHLEPDVATGYAYLQATRNALESAIGGEGAVQKRIVIVSHDAYPHGAQYLALNMTRSCVESFGYEVDLLVLGDGPLKSDFAKWSTVYDLAGIDPSGEEARAIIRSLRMRGVACAICNTTVSGSIVTLLKDEGFTVISLIHELPELIRQYGLEQNALLIAEKADQVVFAAETVAAGFSQFAEVSESKSVIRPQGLYKINERRRKQGGIEAARAELRRRLNIAPDASIVLAVGYADKRKGVDLFVEAGVKLLGKRSDVKFIWLGKEAEPDWMLSAKAPAVQAGVINSFIFPGLDEDTDVYYAGADLYAMTSREDPYPSVVLEAMDCGLPIVAFAGTGGMGALIDEAAGTNVAAFDTDAFADEMNRILGSKPARDQSSRLGQQIINQRFSFRQYVHDLLNLGGEPLPRISVVVPNYNYARYIEDRLRTICNQTIPVYELIVLDDLSTDDSVERINEFLAKVDIPSQFVVNEQNSGSVFRQWLRGVEAAKGDYVWIAEADDLADPEFLAEVMPAFMRSDVIMSYCQSRQMDSEGNIMCEHYLDYVADIDEGRWTKPYTVDGKEEIKTALYLKNTIPNVSAAVFRRDVLLQTLRTHKDEIMSYRNAGDWVTYIRLLETGSVSYSPKSLNSHRRHQSSVTIGNANERHLAEIRMVQEDTMSRNSLGVEYRSAAYAYYCKIEEHFGLNCGGNS